MPGPGFRQVRGHLCLCGDRYHVVVADTWIRVIPIDPAFIPETDAAEQARSLLDSLALSNLGGQAARIIDAGKILFVDAGEYFQSVGCPWCGSLIEIDWWQERMSTAFNDGFMNLAIRTPCCDVTSSLNDLMYDWPQGFAQWRLEVMNPATADLSPADVLRLVKRSGLTFG